MAKTKQYYVCNNCSYQTIKWLGNCPSCREWDTFEQTTASASNKVAHAATTTLKDLVSVPTQSTQRMLSGILEWDRIAGGGIMPGAFMMLTGDPGIGKSTLLLQVAYALADRYSVFYFSSEESLEQVKLRAERLNCLSTKLLFSDEANLDDIVIICEEKKPHIIIVDSIQNCISSETQSLPGSVGQLREAAFRLMRLAKEHNIAIILSGHITKDGLMAGPKTLEHMVDAVFYLQGEDQWQTRMLRAVKNRFGTVNELGFFEMQENGLREVPNINQHLLEDMSESAGSVLISHLEGSRPLLLELQALTISTKFGVAQRVISGIDHTQVVLIAAILEKYLHIKFSAHDIFFKVSGGFKIKGSGADLGIALALLSSFFQKPLPEKSLALGEVSLTGTIKPINHVNIHLQEASKFGIKQLLLAKNQKISGAQNSVKYIAHIYELLAFFGD